MSITETEYRTEVNELAESIVNECKADNPDASADDLREAVNDRIWETIDGHQWVIYTHYNAFVIGHSSNADYYVDNFGAEGLADGVGVLCKLAFGALYADVMEAIDDDEIETWGSSMILTCPDCGQISRHEEEPDVCPHCGEGVCDDDMS